MGGEYHHHHHHHHQRGYAGYPRPNQYYLTQDRAYATELRRIYDAEFRGYNPVRTAHGLAPQVTIQTPGTPRLPTERTQTPGQRRSSQSAPRDRSRSSRREIRFYDRGQPYYEFTNFSPHAVMYDGKVYPTSEHLFQSLKFEDPADAERIRVQRSPREALHTARQMSSRTRRGWVHQRLNVEAMELVLLAKFTQHSALKRLLLETGDVQLIEDAPGDAFWGIGADGRGRNELGMALMKVRRALREFA